MIYVLTLLHRQILTVLNSTWSAQLVQDCAASVGAVRNSLTISCLSFVMLELQS